ncbi:hypothetical protein JCM19046_4645 [Bacillus sp. JCM 19046]|nr:hypothetical protein JCM19045_4424 [Bacillus sp. JCM 19045]GAF19950.1 hypothetical protein JCM19046_4645 [Bacillus sp. JCM 19046]
MSYEILSMPGYRAMGIKTEVMYDDNISGLEEGMHSIKERVKEFDYIQDATTHLALSYHLHPNGFVHYSVFKVYPEQPLLKGMVDMLVPALTYMKATLSVNDNVYEVYQSLENYLLKSAYKPYTDARTTYYDTLPIKHEHYPLQAEYQQYEIWIPVQKRVGAKKTSHLAVIKN